MGLNKWLKEQIALKEEIAADELAKFRALQAKKLANEAAFKARAAAAKAKLAAA